MKIYIPKDILSVSKEFSKFKTPEVRSAGFTEQSGQERGKGDLYDTVAGLMLTHYLAHHKIPCKYQMALLQGDDYDVKANDYTINIKTSGWSPKVDNFDEVKYHMAIKESEFHKLNSIYHQIMVHLDDPHPHLHFCGWIDLKSLGSLEKNSFYSEIPNTGGSKGLWIPSYHLRSFREMIGFLRISAHIADG